MSSFTRVDSFEASYSDACWRDGSTALAASTVGDVKNRKENAQKTVRILFEELIELKLRILLQALVAVESAIDG